MSKEVFYGLCGLMFGIGVLVNWWFEMFSDSPYAELCRSIMDSSFDLGRNTIAFIEPAFGLMMLFGGIGILLDDNSTLAKPFLAVSMSFSVLGFIGMIPFPLPKPMYPEWQMDKRRRRRAKAHKEELATNQDDSLPPQVDHPENSPPDRESQPPITGPHHSDS